MRSSAGRGTDRWLSRAARRLGFDRNPLRRGTDRVKAILRLILVILLGRRVLDRRRLSAWEAEWRASGPLWNGRHG